MQDNDFAFSSSRILSRVEKVIQGGWLVANLTRRHMICSPHVVKMLGFPDSIVRFEDITALMHPDDRDRIALGVEMLSQYGKVNSNLRIRRPEEPGQYHNMRIRLGELAQENGCTMAYGIVQALDTEDENTFNWNVLNTQYKELKYWQHSVPKLLMMLLEDKKFREVVPEMLRAILGRFNADRVYLMEYNSADGTRRCLYEEVRPGVEMVNGLLQHTPTDLSEWWHKSLFDGSIVVVDDRQRLHEERLKEELERLSISSSMLVPMIETGETWGYIGVDVVNQPHEWLESEQAWFKAIGNIVSVGLALRRSYSDAIKEQEHLRHLQDNIPVGMEIYDSNGTLIEANQRAIDMIGFVDVPNMLSLGVNLFDNTFISEEDRNKLRAGESIMCDVVYVENEFSRNFFKNTNGSKKNIIIYASALRDDKGEIVNYIMILSDHTEYVKTHSELQEFQKMFSSMAEFSTVGFFRMNLMDVNMSYLATDQWFTNFNSVRPSSTLASSLIPDTIDPQDAAEMGAFMSNLTEGGQREYHKQVRVLNDDGTMRWLRVFIKAVDYRPTEGVVMLFGLSVDVTQLKDVELALIEAKTKAEQSDQLKSAFLANMSHEIRTPLNAIVGFSNMIAYDPTSEMNSEFASLVEKNNDLLLQIVSDVLDLAKIQAGMFETVASNTNLNEMCREVVSSFGVQTKEDVLLRLNLPLNDLLVMCDRNRVVQIINKFVGNALKFTQKGSIEIGFEVKDLDQKKFVEFYVLDTGIGMSEEQARNCFDNFSKADDFVQGIGLGLSVAKEMVSKLGGTIGVESTEGQGSRFWFRLPYVPRESSFLKDELAATTVDGNKPVILVAEDTMINYLLISSILKQHYTVVVVNNGEEAVRMHAEQKVDLILMDMKMPVMNGLEATRTIRRVDTTTPIVAITAFAFEYDKKAALEAGCNYVLIKPINHTQLRKIVKQLIETGNYRRKTMAV